ncbi:MAG TPA: phytanoyl-CoA dioxygenase family protein [Chthonomonadaceae bacterium]|nr:phytanoyl-CoA dioxygenase family protein [Chthonomonadaceae bacterium]
MNLASHLRELDEQGFTLLPGFVDRETTAAIRAFIDETLRAGYTPLSDRGSTRFHYRICHPIEAPIAAQPASDRRILDIAARCLRAENLRLRQQMFMLTLPCGDPPPSVPDGWHIDIPFLPTEWQATPSQIFIQFFYYCSPVRPGGAATMAVPGSHKLTYAAAADLCRTEEGRRAFTRDPAGLASVDTSQGIEVLAEEGDVLIFNPMLVHSGSKNVTQQPRYAFHCSFHDHSSDRVRRLPAPVFYDTFPASMEAAMPADLRPLLER